MANTSKRGFASMDASKQREIASKGGRAAHAKGTAHEFTSDEARVAGRKGGEAVSRDRAHMSAIGREGGHSRGRARQEQRTSPSSQQQGASQSSGSSANMSNMSSARESNERPSFIGQEHGGNDRGTASQGNSSGSTQRSGDNNRDQQGRRDF
jgi:general stress protein YciG